MRVARFTVYFVSSTDTVRKTKKLAVELHAHSLDPIQRKLTSKQVQVKII